MFERYTEAARRVIFFARYEASQYGSAKIESEHLLLGLLREDKRLARTTLRAAGASAAIRQEIDSKLPHGPRIPTSVEVPLSTECKAILRYASDSAEHLQHSHIDTVHLLLGILREEQCGAAKILLERGLDTSAVQKRATETPPNPSRPAIAEFATAAKADKALEEFLEAWKARDAESISGFFDATGLFADLRGQLWRGSAEIQKKLAAFFAVGNLPGGEGEVVDVRYVAMRVSVAMIDWAAGGASQSPSGMNLRIVLVLRSYGASWRIVSAHLMEIGPPES